MTAPPEPPLERVTVVIPAFNCADLLERQLAALHEQRCDVSWDVVIGDNGSRDHTPAVVATWQQRGLPVSLVDASARRGPAAARNIAAAVATGEALIFTDADDQVGAGWLAASVAALADADVVAGFLDFKALNGLGEPKPQDAWPRQFSYLPAGLGANLAIRGSVFRDFGGFDEALIVGEDIDLCWRLQEAGYRFAFAPDAVVHKSERIGTSDQARQTYAYGCGDPVLYRRHRSHGMPRALPLALKTYAWLLLNAVTVLLSARHRARWSRVLFLRLGRLVGSWQQRVFYP